MVSFGPAPFSTGALAPSRLRAVLALLLFAPFVGPALDHHIAERSPGHLHFPHAAQLSQHVHLYDVEHAHDAAVHPDGVPPHEQMAAEGTVLVRQAPESFGLTGTGTGQGDTSPAPGTGDARLTASCQPQPSSYQVAPSWRLIEHPPC